MNWYISFVFHYWNLQKKKMSATNKVKEYLSLPHEGNATDWIGMTIFDPNSERQTILAESSEGQG